MIGVGLQKTPTAQERMREFDQLMLSYGYRPPCKDDLVTGADLLMVEVETFMQLPSMDPAITSCGTRIKLDDPPIRPSNIDEGKKVVYYHCTMPPWDGQCFVPLDDFCATGYRSGAYSNDTRWVIKLR
jgi:hypothetical protein